MTDHHPEEVFAIWAAENEYQNAIINESRKLVKAKTEPFFSKWGEYISEVFWECLEEQDGVGCDTFGVKFRTEEYLARFTTLESYDQLENYVHPEYFFPTILACYTDEDLANDIQEIEGLVNRYLKEYHEIAFGVNVAVICEPENISVVAMSSWR